MACRFFFPRLQHLCFLNFYFKFIYLCVCVCVKEFLLPVPQTPCGSQGTIFRSLFSSWVSNISSDLKTSTFTESPGPLQVTSVSLLTSYCFRAQMPIVFLIVCQHLHLLSSKEHNIFFILHAVLF